MLFNSIPFFIFFSVFFCLYWSSSNSGLRGRNLVLLAGSYFFYAWYDWRFLFLLIGSSALNYYLGIFIHKTKNQKWRNVFIGIGLLQGLGGLFVFKYLNFFIDSFAQCFSYFELPLQVHTLDFVLPLGISFYTFRTISYLLDIDKGKIEAVTDWTVFFNYVSFFPSLIAGPIDRAGLLVPQLSAKQKFNSAQAADGMRQILWGLFKKIVIADNCATLTNVIFENDSALPASSLFFGALLYTVQIYADFSGYSDMAIGIARLIGFNITRNFDFPFFAQNIAEFWRKWHISLTTWLTDYVFTPLSIAFRNYDKLGLIFAIVINFTLIGIWHGANWTFVLFGFLHGCYYIPLILKGTLNKRKKIAKDARMPTLREFGNMLGTFLLVTLTFVIFRSPSISAAINYIQQLFSVTLFSRPVFDPNVNHMALFFFILCMLLVEWFQRAKQHGLQFSVTDKLSELPARSISRSLRWVIYITLVFCILCFEGKVQDFIYLKF